MASIGNQLSLNGLLMRAVKINVFFFHTYVFCFFFYMQLMLLHLAGVADGQQMEGPGPS